MFGGIQVDAAPLDTPNADAKRTQVQADFKALRNALDMFKLVGGAYPTTAERLKALVEKPTAAPIPKRWSMMMMSEPLDPWKNPYSYKFPGTKKAEDPEIISSGTDGIKGTADDISSQAP